MRECIQEPSGQLNRWERIKDFRIHDHDRLSRRQADAERKLNRKVLESRDSSLLDSMYTG